MATRNDPVAEAIYDLVLANRVLAQEGGLDAWGHVSIRHPIHPERYLLACSRSPELVVADDIVEHGLDGEAIVPDARPLYLERYIHAAVYHANPVAQSVIHSHADEVLPFSITGEPLRAVMISAKSIGATIPVWDVEDAFGPGTDLLVSNLERGHDLARRLGDNTVTLMRGHGFIAVGPTLLDAVNAAVYLPRNAQVLMNALRLGPVKSLSPQEVATRAGIGAETFAAQRAWEYWAHRVGIPYRRGAFARSSARRT